MTITKLSLVLICLITGMLMAQEAKVTQLLRKDLTDLPNKEGLMITVEYAPGGSALYVATMHMGLFTCWKGRSSCR
jgi:hypothetical protein